jgi:hypothetical protein
MGTPAEFFYFGRTKARDPVGPQTFVGPAGLEPATRGLKVRCSTN